MIILLSTNIYPWPAATYEYYSTMQVWISILYNIIISLQQSPVIWLIPRPIPNFPACQC